MKHIGNEIKRLIDEQHLTKIKVAQAVGISPNYLSTIFLKSSIDCALLEKICKVINAHPAQFFDDGTNSSYHVSGLNTQSQFGNATVQISQGEASAMHQLLAEKERTINILLRSKGFYPPEQTGTELGQQSEK